jgi:hypothetical protein
MAGRAPQAHAAPHRTGRPRRQSRYRGFDRRRPRHDRRRAPMERRQTQEGSRRTGTSAMGRKGEASVPGLPDDTQGDRSSRSRGSSLMHDSGMSAELTTCAEQRSDMPMALQAGRQNSRSAKFACIQKDNVLCPTATFDWIATTPRNYSDSWSRKFHLRKNRVP